MQTTKRAWLKTIALVLIPVAWSACSTPEPQFASSGVGGDADTTEAGSGAASGSAHGGSANPEAGADSVTGGAGFSSGGTEDAGGQAAGGSGADGGADAWGGSAGAGGSAGSGGSSSCMDVTSDAKNCGKCGHDCGALAACESSRCQPAPIITGLLYAQSMDVSPKGVFYSTNNTLQYCTNAASCLATQEQIGSPSSANKLAVTKTLATDMIGFFGRNAASEKYAGYHTCPVSGCGATSLANPGPSGAVNALTGMDGELYYQTSGSSDPSLSVLVRMTGNADGTQGAKLTIGDRAVSINRLAVDASYVYYLRVDTDNLANVVACSRSNGCGGTYTSLGTGDPSNFAAYGGKLYWLNGIQLKRCDVTNPSVITPVASLPAVYDKDMLIDGTNIYWLTASSVVYCALPSCTGGVKTLTSGLAAPSMLRMAGSFLYWLIPSDSGAATGGIYRIAKP